jgi:hypothetical protein
VEGREKPRQSGVREFALGRWRNQRYCSINRFVSKPVFKREIYVLKLGPTNRADN